MCAIKEENIELEWLKMYLTAFKQEKLKAKGVVYFHSWRIY